MMTNEGDANELNTFMKTVRLHDSYRDENFETVFKQYYNVLKHYIT